MIIDFHTHCFSDAVVKRAMSSLQSLSGYKAYTDGSIKGLRNSMVNAKVDISVVHPIATKAMQTKIINDWAIQIDSTDVICFGTIHHEYKEWKNEIIRLKNNEISGVKFHPDYQNFWVDDKKMYPIYEFLAELDLIAMFHCGEDIAYPDEIKCPPSRLAHVLDDIPNLRIVGAHMGGHKMFDEVYDVLCGKDIYLDTSFTHYLIGSSGMEKIIKKHGVDKILFGTDSPWDDVQKAINMIQNLNLSNEDKEMILSKNAQRLLDI